MLGLKPLEMARERNLQVRLGSAKALGAIIGRGDNHVSSHALEVVESYAPLLAAIQHPLVPTQLAFGILRVCASSRFTSTTRTQPPQLIQDAIHSFDDARIECFNNLHNTSIPTHIPHDTLQLEPDEFHFNYFSSSISPSTRLDSASG